MGYSKHLTSSEIRKIWTSEKDNEFGVWIGNDLLIKGEFMETELNYHGVEFDEIDWESEYTEFSEDSYYIIRNLHHGMYDSIHEIGCMEDLANSNYWYD